MKKKYHPIIVLCPECKTRMGNLHTKEGDPEGIRSDYYCKKCKVVYGCTKAHRYLIQKNVKSPKDWKERYSDK